MIPTESVAMQTIVDEAIRSDPELARAVERTSRIIASELGSSSERLTVEWQRDHDGHGQPLLRLTIVAPPESKSAAFTSDELHLRKRVNHLWIDLLQDRVNRLLTQLDDQLVAVGDHGAGQARPPRSSTGKFTLPLRT